MGTLSKVNRRRCRDASILGSACLLLFAGTAHAQPALDPSSEYADSTLTAPSDFLSATPVRAFWPGDTAKIFASVSGDFDQKNGTDIATFQADGRLNVLWNDGTGKLLPAYTNDSALQLAPNIVYAEAADFNGDGLPDLVAEDTNNSAFLVFLNQGTGKFASAVSVNVKPANGTTIGSGGLTVADVNGDGKPDVVTIAQRYSQPKTLFSQLTFLGKGDGTFQSPIQTDTTLTGDFFINLGRGLVLGDMNRDSKRDLIVQLYNNGNGTEIVSVSVGNGQGSFGPITTAGPTVPADTQPASSLAVGDITGDSIPDVLFISFSDQVYLSRGKGDGTLGAAESILTNVSGAVLLTIGDFNRDGKTDLVVFGSGQFGLLNGNGDGTFQASGQYSGGYGIFQQPRPADFNGDGNLDVAFMDYTAGRMGMYFGDGGGKFISAIPVRPENNNREWAGNIQAITAADFNGDQKADVLSYVWEHASAGGPADLFLGRNDGTARLSYVRALPPGRLQELAQMYRLFTIQQTTADFSGDGRPDVILSTQAGLSIMLANGDGTMNPNPVDATFPVAVNCLPFGYVSTGDVNGDGFQDIAASYMNNPNCGPAPNTPTGFFILLGDGTGHFETHFTPFGNSLFFIRLADLNSDGKLDLLTADLNSTGGGFRLYAIPGVGDGTFDTAAAQIPLDHQAISNLLVGDYNVDGEADLAISTDGIIDANGSPTAGTEGVLLLPGLGNLQFGDATHVLWGMRSIWNGTAFSDMDGDGRPDLVFATWAQANTYMPNFGLIVLHNQGGGQFGAPSSDILPLDVSSRNTYPFVADFNGDGAKDVIVGGGLSSPLFLNRR